MSKTKEEIREKMSLLSDILSNAGFRSEIEDNGKYLTFCFKFREHTFAGFPQEYYKNEDKKGPK